MDFSLLNSQIQAQGLPIFEKENTYFNITRLRRYYKFEYTIGFGGTMQSTDNSLYSTSFSGSNLSVTTGYSIFKKGNINVIPHVGIGFGSASMTVLENPLPTATNFNQALIKIWVLLKVISNKNKQSTNPTNLIDLK